MNINNLNISGKNKFKELKCGITYFYRIKRWKQNNPPVEYVSNSVQSLSRVWIFVIPWTSGTRTPDFPVRHQLPELAQTHIHWYQWCHLTISPSVIPFSSCLQSFPASGSLQMSQFFTSGGQSTGVSASASVLPMNIQDWFPLGWTGWIS